MQMSGRPEVNSECQSRTGGLASRCVAWKHYGTLWHSTGVGLDKNMANDIQMRVKSEEGWYSLVEVVRGYCVQWVCRMRGIPSLSELSVCMAIVRDGYHSYHPSWPWVLDLFRGLLGWARLNYDCVEWTGSELLQFVWAMIGECHVQ